MRRKAELYQATSDRELKRALIVGIAVAIMLASKSAEECADTEGCKAEGEAHAHQVKRLVAIFQRILSFVVID